MPVCMNYLTIISAADDDILRELKHIPDLQIVKHGDKGMQVRFKSESKPDFDWLQSLNKRCVWWIKDEWISENGLAGVWIGNGNEIKNYEWDDLSLEELHEIF